MVAVVHRRPCLQHLACCRHIGSESRFLPTPPAFDAPLAGFPLEYRHPVWYGKTRMVWLPDGEKILTQLTNVTDTQTPHDAIGRTMHHIVRQKCQTKCALKLQLMHD